MHLLFLFRERSFTSSPPKRYGSDIKALESNERMLFPETVAALWFDRTVHVISCTLLGLVGNTLTIVLLLQPRLRKYPTAVYMTGLAVADTGVLVTGILLMDVPRLIHGEAMRYNIYFCKLGIFVHRWFGESSCWILTCMSVERALAISMPMKAKKLISKKISKSCCVMTFIVVGACLSYLIILQEDHGGICVVRDSAYFNKWVKFTIDYILCIFVPVIVIFMSNFAIIFSILRSKEEFVNVNVRRKDGSIFLFFMLIAVSFAFVILKTPYHLFVVLTPHDISVMYDYATREEAKHRLALSIVINMQYLNHCINFYLYTLSSREFRTELKALIKRCMCMTNSPRSMSQPFETITTNNSITNPSQASTSGIMTRSTQSY